MDFDEYDYLEKTVEGSAAPSNGASAPRTEEKERSSRRRSGGGGDENRDDGERRSKRSRSEENRDRHRHREKDRERHRSSRERHDRDRDEKDKVKEKAKAKEKEKEKERDKDKERRSRDREEDKEREREKEREMEMEKDRERRSRSRSERRRDEEDYRERERHRDRDYRDRDVRRRKEEVAEPEADPERDQRTVFAYQLSLKADERDVYEFFSMAGKVRDVRLIMDRNSRRSKGLDVLFKEIILEVHIIESILLLGGRRITIAFISMLLCICIQYYSDLMNFLYQVFEPFGQVELVQLPLDPLSGLCKGFGFIQASISSLINSCFARLEDAKAAQSLNGQLDIAGRVIKISAVTDQAGMQVSGVTTGDLDDDEGGGLALNASSRALLMQKLDRSSTTTSLTSGIGATGLNTSVVLPPASVLGAPPTAAVVLQTAVPGLGSIPGASLPITTQSIEMVPPSECILLKNMFDPAVETDPDFDLDIRDDVQKECSKFGQVKHIFVDKNTAGFVYLQFDSITAAMNAQKALHGRWFAGKMITATYMSPEQYQMKFPS
ncbi:hypothetical protein ABZP36_017879 [Zizania latifolia]